MVNVADFHLAYSKANDFLIQAGVFTFPLDIFNFIKSQPNCVCRKFSMAQRYGVDISAFGSESAVLIQQNDKTIIFVDDNKPLYHTTFSIAHELGHLACKHNLLNQDLPRDIYDRYEIEANYFAAQLLMPEQIIREFQRRGVTITCSFLQKTFGVSEAAALKRISTFKRVAQFKRDSCETRYDDIILLCCKPMIDNICPQPCLYNFEEDYETQLLRNGWM